jgi:tRNA (guanine-N7-)-methyltransferase
VSVRRTSRLPLEQLAPYLLSLPDPPTPFDWSTVFGNAYPVELEVGFGKGLFLTTSAQVRPEVNFVGVEIVRKYQLLTATRLAKASLGNVRLACGDGRLFLRDRVVAGSLQALHVYFPDPWWKKRHQKRRLFTDEFVAECPRVLRPGGRFHIATDVAEYAAVMEELLAAQPLLRPLAPPSPGEPNHDLDYLTHFERKFRMEGRPIHRLLYERTAAPTCSTPIAAPVDKG